MHLMPCLLSTAIEADRFDLAAQNHVMDCMECGSCAYVCPDHRPLVQNIRRAKAELRRRGVRVLDARNGVREGIAATAVLIGRRLVKAEREHCPSLIREIHGYLWDDKARRRGEERPVKDHDHAMDALRYLCHTRASPLRRA